jgi:sarcosine oxidase subunit gamma
MPPLDLIPVSAFAGLPSQQGDSAGVVIRERDGLGLATVHARKGRADRLASRLRERFGIELPVGPRRAAAGDVSFMGTSPDAWLASQEGGGNAFAASLREAISDIAAVADQSDGYAVLRISGASVRDALCKLISVDLDPGVFRVGDAATTAAGHVGAMLWRLEDAADGASVFEISVYRSFAASFWQELIESAAGGYSFRSLSSSPIAASYSR